ncbi:hypothetical protein [Mucilaginibacter defluvii]|uniref:Uncharacterized protein n=1 Tax=Mucilaginibacter defluvii TaxID=1196019 RepID=A0ABP9FV79_9SPHI
MTEQQQLQQLAKQIFRIKKELAEDAYQSKLESIRNDAIKAAVANFNPDTQIIIYKSELFNQQAIIDEIRQMRNQDLTDIKEAVQFVKSKYTHNPDTAKKSDLSNREKIENVKAGLLKKNRKK